MPACCSKTTSWMKSTLSEAITIVIEEFSPVKFLPLNIKVEESIGDLLLLIDYAVQYREDLDVRSHNFEAYREGDEDLSYGFDD
ncbi:hypothetical protein HPB48_001553 [Haemaphysalis longicornis]|uniref:Uncharacterized protein n=1 Tax=Haemaphysalis longicornis TaxID=44386 RepID=A0A9J6FE73_HAELO|nr:hypothetical protein HPB48_001553 [Haemaphysalis longicornis]